jgi:membrane-bound lytic murein transglycosylase D
VAGNPKNLFRSWVFVAAFLFWRAGQPASAAEGDAPLDDWIRSAEKWADENIDQDALRALQSGDRDHIQRLFADLQKQFHSDYVIDLAALEETARELLPLLEQYEETLPYALWLRSRLDYLTVAKQWRHKNPPLPAVPGKPAPPPANPTPENEREIWISKVASRPWPANAKNYVPRLKKIFAAEKVPEQLVWVAEVESSFDPRARSPVGAAGMFQLMPATASRYGLRTWPIDQRLRPEESAQTAARYLAYLHRHFKDWRLALAAYNAGEGTIDKQLAKKKAHTFDAIAMKLPAETQMYVPRVEATILKREGLTLAELR